MFWKSSKERTEFEQIHCFGTYCTFVAIPGLLCLVQGFTSRSLDVLEYLKYLKCIRCTCVSFRTFFFEIIRELFKTSINNSKYVSKREDRTFSKRKDGTLINWLELIHLTIKRCLPVLKGFLCEYSLIEYSLVPWDFLFKKEENVKLYIFGVSLDPINRFDVHNQTKSLC